MSSSTLVDWNTLPPVNRPIRLEPFHLPILRRQPLLVEPKLDGWRVRAGVWQGVPVCRSRTDKQVECAPSLLDSLQALPDYTLLDGELIGETLHVFDVLLVGGEAVYPRPLQERYALRQHLAGWRPNVCAVQGQVLLPSEPVSPLLDPVPGDEGRVLKGWHGSYQAPWYKLKFVKRLTAVLLSSDGESGTAGLWTDATLMTMQEICGLKIPLGLTPGSSVEVEYLTVSPRMRLVQPVYKGLRTDVGLEDLTLAVQLPP